MFAAEKKFKEFLERLTQRKKIPSSVTTEILKAAHALLEEAYEQGYEKGLDAYEKIQEKGKEEEELLDPCSSW